MKWYLTVTPEGVKEYPIHNHEVYEVMIYLDGEGKLRIENKEYPFNKGSIFIIPPFVKHGSISKNGYKNVCIHTDDILFNNTTAICIRDNENRDAENLINILSRAYFGDLSKNSALVNNLYFAYREVVLKLATDNKTQLLDKIANEFSANIGNEEYNPSLAFIDKGYSVDHLKFLFKKKYQTSPIEYFTNLRINYAKTLLEIYSSKLKINQIALLCGFKDALYFSKVFKSKTGKSPSDFLRSIKE